MAELTLETNTGAPQQAAPPPSEGDDTAESLNRLIARYWLLFRKFYWIVILTSALGVVAGYFYTQRQPRIYQAASKIMFRDVQPNPFGSEIERVNLVDPGGRWQFDQFWNTQKQVLQSRWFARTVIEREGLLDDEKFVRQSPNLSEEQRMQAGIGRILGMVSYVLQPNSRVIDIQVRATDPELAQQIANAVADTYVQHMKDYQSGGLNKIVTWFDSYVVQKRKQLNDSLAELHKFKRDNNILSISFEDRQNLTADNIDAVNEQLNYVRGQLDEAESILRQLEQIERSGDDPRAITELIAGTSLGSTLEQEANVLKELAGLESMYGPEHIKVKKLRSELKSLRGNIDAEIARIRAGVKNKVAMLKNTASRKEQRLAELKNEAFELNELGLQYNQIKDEADSLRKLYDTVLSRSEELDINSMYETEQVEVLQHARKPGGPISPSMPINLGIGLVIGLLIGASTIVLIDTLDNTVRGQRDIERYTRKPILGHLPQIDQSLLKEFGSIDAMTEIAPRSSFSEGIRTLRTNLMFMSPDNPPRLLLVTSPGPGEGKTLISINMAIAMAHSGLRTLVVDSDMRRPRVHKALNIENVRGLSGVIAGTDAIADVVQETGIDNLHVMTCGAVPPNPSELLHSERFHRTVEELRARYDRVIFDSPPLAAVADGLVLSHSVDAVLLILKFGRTRKELLRRSIEQLEAIGAPFMGTVLNDIDANVGSAYAYSYYYYRYRYDDSDDPKKKGTRLAS